MKNLLIDVSNLSVMVDTFSGPLQVVRHMDLQLRRGEIVGLVGESGSGKSMTLASFMSLHDPDKTHTKGDRLHILGHDCLAFTEEDWRLLRGHQVAMIFQDPMTALNPILSIGQQLMEIMPKGQASMSKAIELLTQVGLTDPARRVSQYPYELSGGMRQRVVIAMALAGQPKILLADEPTTALDVTTEAQILHLLQGLVRKSGLGLVFVSHNLRVVSQLCDRVMVMYAGQWVEKGPVESVFFRPKHPYTQALLGALPQGKQKGQLKAIPGRAPDLTNLPKGCPFYPRCSHAMQICAQKEAPIEILSLGDKEHSIRCWLPAAEREWKHESLVGDGGAQ
jgi:hypothetical protein